VAAVAHAAAGASACDSALASLCEEAGITVSAPDSASAPLPHSGDPDLVAAVASRAVRAAGGKLLPAVRGLATAAAVAARVAASLWEAGAVDADGRFAALAAAVARVAGASGSLLAAASAPASHPLRAAVRLLQGCGAALAHVLHEGFGVSTAAATQGPGSRGFNTSSSQAAVAAEASVLPASAAWRGLKRAYVRMLESALEDQEGDGEETHEAQADRALAAPPLRCLQQLCVLQYAVRSHGAASALCLLEPPAEALPAAAGQLAASAWAACAVCLGGLRLQPRAGRRAESGGPSAWAAAIFALAPKPPPDQGQQQQSAFSGPLAEDAAAAFAAAATAAGSPAWAQLSTGQAGCHAACLELWTQAEAGEAAPSSAAAVSSDLRAAHARLWQQRHAGLLAGAAGPLGGGTAPTPAAAAAAAAAGGCFSGASAARPDAAIAPRPAAVPSTTAVNDAFDDLLG